MNCGSATVKTKLFGEDGGRLTELAARTDEIGASYRVSVERALAELPAKPDAIAHRVVYGGDDLGDAVVVTAGMLLRLRDVAEVAPLHTGPALAGIEATLSAGVPLAAAFDTAFHRGMPEVARRYALPGELGVHRHGFHGWSHRSVAESYAALTGTPEPTIVSLHLGGGCSAAAIRRGKSVDTSMGFTPLEGLVMGTRPGDLDPGIITHLLRGGMSLADLERLLHRESGLLALTGTSDMRELLRREDPAARFAVDLFCYRVRKYVGAYLAVLEGAEAVVFTGAIGERSPEIRRRIGEPLGWAGLALSDERNQAGTGRISTDDSRLAAYVIPTDEERLIARETARLLGWDVGADRSRADSSLPGR